MKDYQKYLTELFGIGKRDWNSKSDFMLQVVKWFKDKKLVDKFQTHRDYIDGSKFGLEGVNPTTGDRFWIQPSRDGTEATIVVNKGQYDIDIDSIEELEMFSKYPELKELHGE